MGSVALFSGQFAKFLKDKLNLFDSAYILTGTQDPRATATDAPSGSILMRQGLAGQVFYKIDDGLTTNWKLLPSTDDIVVAVQPASGFQMAYVEEFADTSAVEDDTTATLDTGRQLYRIACDKSLTVTTSGTDYTLSGTPSFTLVAGDIVYSGGAFRKIVTISTATTGVLDAAFPVDLSSDACMVSQAVWTRDIINFTGDATEKTRPRDFFPGVQIAEINIDYLDSLVQDDSVPDFVDEARVVVAATADGEYTDDMSEPASSLYTAPFTRPQAPNQIDNYPLAPSVRTVGGVIYVGAGGINLSTDGGASFVNRNTTDGLGANNGFDVAVEGLNVYVATSGGLSISNDGGNTFVNRTMADGLGANDCRGVSVSGLNVYVATSGGGIAISNDGGATFTAIGTGQGLNSDFCNGIRFVDGVIYVVHAGGLDVSSDGGLNWSFTNVPGSGNDVYVSGLNVYVASAGALSISDNGGASFVQRTTLDGLGSDNCSGVWVDGLNVYVTHNNFGISISTDGGVTFTAIDTSGGLGSTDCRKIWGSGSTIYVTTAGGFSISADFGATFVNRTTAQGLGANGSAGLFVSPPSPVPNQRLFMVFFANPDNADVVDGANLIRYRASFYSDPGVSDGGILDSAFAMSDGSADEVNCDAPTVEGGVTRLRLHWNYIPNVNPGTTAGDLEVVVDGKVLPRLVAGATMDAYFTEVSGTTDEIAFWDDLSVTPISIEVRRRQGSIDTSDQNRADLDGMLSPLVLTSNTTLTQRAHTRVIANSAGGAFTITLPATPQPGDRIEIQDPDGSWFDENITIDPNGNTIRGVGSNDTLDVNYGWIMYEWVGGSQGWMVRV